MQSQPHTRSILKFTHGSAWLYQENLNAAQNGTLADVFDREAMHMMRCFMTDDHKAAVQALWRSASGFWGTLIGV